MVSRVASKLLLCALQAGDGEVAQCAGTRSCRRGSSCSTTLEDVVPDDHPLRGIRALVDVALEEMRPSLDALYAERGRPSVAPST